RPPPPPARPARLGARRGGLPRPGDHPAPRPLALADPDHPGQPPVAVPGPAAGPAPRRGVGGGGELGRGPGRVRAGPAAVRLPDHPRRARRGRARPGRGPGRGRRRRGPRGGGGGGLSPPHPPPAPPPRRAHLVALAAQRVVSVPASGDDLKGARVARMGSDLPVVLLSHRGPVSFERDPSAGGAGSRGAGGLVTALAGLISDLPDAVWVCAASSDEDVA